MLDPWKKIAQNTPRMIPIIIPGIAGSLKETITITSTGGNNKKMFILNKLAISFCNA